MPNPDFTVLESKIEELIKLFQLLARENHALKTQQSSWSSERAQLIEKNELAKTKVEAMISRLKALEHD
ncbi:MAG: TIGR02449 family protein [Pseudomonadales bacterium]